MYLFRDRKTEMDFRYPIDYNILLKKGFQTLDDLKIRVCKMDYSDDSFVLLIEEINYDAYKHYETLKEIITALQKNILDYEIFEYNVASLTWKVIFHKL